MAGTFPIFKQLQSRVDDLRRVRDAVEPIYTYYFPQSWWSVMARRWGLTPQPDFARHLMELKDLRDTAWKIVEESKAAVHALASSGIELQFRQMAQHLYQQNHYDGTAVILLYEYVSAMQQGDPESKAPTYFFAMGAAANKAKENLSLVASDRTRLAVMWLHHSSVEQPSNELHPMDTRDSQDPSSGHDVT